MSPEAGDVDVIVWEDIDSLEKLDQNYCPKSQSKRTQSPGTVADFTILTTPEQRSKAVQITPKIGWVPFDCIIRTDV